jgi:hypothetical protein
MRSSCVYRFRFRPGRDSIPGRLTPQVLAATAQPTRQSSQWLSGRVGSQDHSRTVPYGPVTSTQLPERATCSANRLWLVLAVPYRLMQPRSDMAVARPLWTKLFQ